jgi:curved DNA-binding protein CbpA
LQDLTQYLDEEFIIWNGTLGIRDFVSIGEVKTDCASIEVWLEEPYEFVGPILLDDLVSCGQISFEACIIMTKQKWQEEKNSFQEDAYKEQCRIQRELNEDIKQHNKKRQQFMQSESCYSEKEYQELLSLPLEGVLESSTIKAAFRKLAKTTHPDVGGSHELFVKITHARDTLLASK